MNSQFSQLKFSSPNIECKARVLLIIFLIIISFQVVNCQSHHRAPAVKNSEEALAWDGKIQTGWTFEKFKEEWNAHSYYELSDRSKNLSRKELFLGFFDPQHNSKEEVMDFFGADFSIDKEFERFQRKRPFHILNNEDIDLVYLPLEDTPYQTLGANEDSVGYYYNDSLSAALIWFVKDKNGLYSSSKNKVIFRYDLIFKDNSSENIVEIIRNFETDPNYMVKEDGELVLVDPQYPKTINLTYNRDRYAVDDFYLPIRNDLIKDSVKLGILDRSLNQVDSKIEVLKSIGKLIPDQLEDIENVYLKYIKSDKNFFNQMHKFQDTNAPEPENIKFYLDNLLGYFQVEGINERVRESAVLTDSLIKHIHAQETEIVNKGIELVEAVERAKKVVSLLEKEEKKLLKHRNNLMAIDNVLTVGLCDQMDYFKSSSNKLELTVRQTLNFFSNNDSIRIMNDSIKKIDRSLRVGNLTSHYEFVRQLALAVENTISELNSAIREDDQKSTDYRAVVGFYKTMRNKMVDNSILKKGLKEKSDWFEEMCTNLLTEDNYKISTLHRDKEIILESEEAVLICEEAEFTSSNQEIQCKVSVNGEYIEVTDDMNFLFEVKKVELKIENDLLYLLKDGNRRKLDVKDTLIQTESYPLIVRNYALYHKGQPVTNDHTFTIRRDSIYVVLRGDPYLINYVSNSTEPILEPIEKKIKILKENAIRQTSVSLNGNPKFSINLVSKDQSILPNKNIYASVYAYSEINSLCGQNISPQEEINWQNEFDQYLKVLRTYEEYVDTHLRPPGDIKTRIKNSARQDVHIIPYLMRVYHNRINGDIVHTQLTAFDEEQIVGYFDRKNYPRLTVYSMQLVESILDQQLLLGVE